VKTVRLLRDVCPKRCRKNNRSRLIYPSCWVIY